MKFAIVFGLFAFVAVAVSEEFKCVDDVSYQENECNHCFCNQGGLACNLMACPSHENKTLTGCEVGKKWTKDCNSCWCVETWGTVCETKTC